MSKFLAKLNVTLRRAAQRRKLFRTGKITLTSDPETLAAFKSGETVYAIIATEDGMATLAEVMEKWEAGEIEAGEGEDPNAAPATSADTGTQEAAKPDQPAEQPKPADKPVEEAEKPPGEPTKEAE